MNSSLVYVLSLMTFFLRISLKVWICDRGKCILQRSLQLGVLLTLFFLLVLSACFCSDQGLLPAAFSATIFMHKRAKKNVQKEKKGDWIVRFCCEPNCVPLNAEINFATTDSTRNQESVGSWTDCWSHLEMGLNWKVNCLPFESTILSLKNGRGKMKEKKLTIIDTQWWAIPHAFDATKYFWYLRFL